MTRAPAPGRSHSDRSSSGPRGARIRPIGMLPPHGRQGASPGTHAPRAPPGRPGRARGRWGPGKSTRKRPAARLRPPGGRRGGIPSPIRANEARFAQEPALGRGGERLAAVGARAAGPQIARRPELVSGLATATQHVRDRNPQCVLGRLAVSIERPMAEAARGGTVHPPLSARSTAVEAGKGAAEAAGRARPGANRSRRLACPSAAAPTWVRGSRRLRRASTPAGDSGDGQTVAEGRRRPKPASPRAMRACVARLTALP